MEFFQTVMGKRYYEHQLPQFLKHLETIGNELKRANDLKEKDGYSLTTLKQIADEIAEVEPALARLLREYID